MKITQIKNQLRNDLYGTMSCECCGHEQTFVGYDDDNYHNKVVPKVKCKRCGISSVELGCSRTSTEDE